MMKSMSNLWFHIRLLLFISLTTVNSQTCDETQIITINSQSCDDAAPQSFSLEYATSILSSDTICFQVDANSECQNPSVMVEIWGDFGGDDEWVEISYNGGNPAICGEDVGLEYFEDCEWGTCSSAAALVSGDTWQANSVHSFSIGDFGEDVDVHICYPNGTMLHVTVTCIADIGPFDCVVDSLSQLNCGQLEEIQNALTTILNLVKSAESSDESNAAFVANSVVNDIDGNADGEVDKNIYLTLSESTQYNLFLLIIVLLVSMLIAICLCLKHYKN